MSLSVKREANVERERKLGVRAPRASRLPRGEGGERTGRSTHVTSPDRRLRDERHANGGFVGTELGTEQGGPWLERAMKDVGFGAWRLDLRTGALEVSEGLVELLGLTTRPIENADLLALVSDDDRCTLDREVRAAIATRRAFRCEVRVNDPVGERWIEARGRATYSGETPIALLGTATDVTDRRRSHDELERSHAALAAHGRALADLARSSVWRSTDRDRAFRELSETAARTLGVERVGIWLFDDDG
ncbi:MAG: PAS domain-containing protein, partial [Myxococcota bacterium]|nr:PAS domain-containing protein [Myxococcota bacterium]